MSRFRPSANASPLPDVAPVRWDQPVAVEPKLPPPPLVSPPQVSPQQQAGMLLVAFVALLIFSHIGRPFEHVLVGLRIPAAICGVALLVALGYVLPVAKTPAGRALTMLFVWMLLTLPFSSWKGGSFSYAMTYLQLWVALFVVVAGVPKSVKHVGILASTMALAAGFNIAIAGQFGEGARFQMEGTFGNSDDVAILAGFAIPFWLFLARRLPMFFRVALSLGMTVFLLRIIILTATRSILISLVCMFLIWLVRQPIATQILALASMAVVFVGLISTAPESVRTRLSTFFDAFSTAPKDGPMDEAAGSAAERQELLKDGIWTTLTHPIWGVGPGQFAHYRWSSLGEPSGKKKASIKTHNTYVQVSAESGIPAGALYVFFLWVTYRTIGRVRTLTAARSSPSLVLGSELASSMEMALVFFAVSAVFMTVEAHPYLFYLAGLATAAERVLREEWRRLQPNQPPAPSWPTWNLNQGRGLGALKPASGFH